METGADGSYVLASMPIGPYRIEISKQGFSTFVQTGLELQVSTSPTVDCSKLVMTAGHASCHTPMRGASETGLLSFTACDPEKAKRNGAATPAD